MNWLPQRKSPHWRTVTLVGWIIVTIALWGIRFLLVQQTFTFTHAFRFLLLSLILNAGLGLFGWLGLRRLWLCGMLGTLLGLLMMALTSSDHTGWEDLAGLLNFIVATCLGILVGAILELLAWIYGVWRRS